jgi:hypothetical protein
LYIYLLYLYTRKEGEIIFINIYYCIRNCVWFLCVCLSVLLIYYCYFLEVFFIYSLRSFFRKKKKLQRLYCLILLDAHLTYNKNNKFTRLHLILFTGSVNFCSAYKSPIGGSWNEKLLNRKWQLLDFFCKISSTKWRKSIFYSEKIIEAGIEIKLNPHLWISFSHSYSCCDCNLIWQKVNKYLYPYIYKESNRHF